MADKTPANNATDAPPSRGKAFLFGALKLGAILGFAATVSHVLFFHFGEVRERDYALNVQSDLVAIDSGKEQYAVDSGKKDGEPAPSSAKEMLKRELLSDPPRMDGAGQYEVNNLGKDPAFVPNREPGDLPLPLKLPVEFSELSTEVEPAKAPPQAELGKVPAE